MQIVTANRLVDGRVVFRTAAGHWSETLAAALLLDAADVSAALAASAADVAARRIVAPYAVEVTLTSSGPVPKTVRERIRAGGPTSGSETLAPTRPARAA
ncbi:MAG: DUF2849 domain-containing protein [Siculibacillus sp.]|nr:DUF2849 domain-containing protein [Siculibacillus sp.]